MKISVASVLSFHEKGTRERNEDNLYVPNEEKRSQGNPLIYMVCDGVGGLDSGELASQIVCDAISSYLEKAEEINESEIVQAIRRAESELEVIAQKYADVEQMATTLTLLVVMDSEIILTHIGDSRIYHFRQDQLIFQTSDHTFVNDLVKQGLLTQSEAQNHPRRNVITRALVSENQPQTPDFHRTNNVRSGDILLLCTDGVLESLSTEQIRDIVSDKTLTMRLKVDRMKQACSRGSNDNYTGVLIKLNREGESPGGTISAHSNITRMKPYRHLGIFVLALLAILALFIVSRSDGEQQDLLDSISNEKIENSELKKLELLKTDSAVKLPIYNVDSLLDKQHGDSE